MNELRSEPSTVLRNCARGRRMACTLTPSAYSETSVASIFLSSTVTSSEVDVGLGPDRVVRQAPAKDRREDRPIALHLCDQCVECRGELLSRISFHRSNAWLRSRTPVYPGALFHRFTS